MRGLRYAWAMAVLSLCGIVPAPARAEVTTTGDTYDDGWSFYVGYHPATTGSLTINAGSVFNSREGDLGYGPGSRGTATVAGAGSKWTNSGELCVGSSGTGTLTVSDGGVVSAKTLYASLGDLYGDGSITVQSGAYLDGALIVDATHSAAQAVSFGSGGILQFPTDGSAELGVGYKQSGSLRIADGRSVTSTGGILGHKSGSMGTAIVTGAGSKWINSDKLYVGYSGSGILRVEAAGQVDTGIWGCYLGCNSGSTGEAIVTGVGSKWTNSGRLEVGSSGTGTLTVSDGGQVSAKTLYASLSDLRGNGSITVQSGGILDADLSFDAAHGPTQTLAFGSGGTLQFTVDGTSDLGVGYKRSGSLRISEGRSVASAYGILGYKSGSTGTAIITGAGSKWTTHDIYVGRDGSGTLTVSDGGVVSAKTLYASLSDLYGDGSITVQSGGILDADLSFDASHGLTQRLAFGSGGTLQFTVDGSSTSTLGAGYKRSGSLRIADGRSVASIDGYLGYNSGSSGTAVITGAGSTWTTDNLYAGYSGSGTLRVEAGAQVRIPWGNFNLGFKPGSTGEAIITGPGSKITSGGLMVGSSSSGTLTISDGGQVTTATLRIYNSQSSVRLHVSGDRMLVLGNASVMGSISNSGKLSLLSDAFLSPGTYRPIAEYADRPLAWLGSYSPVTVGGTWNNIAQTFTVLPSTAVDAGTPAQVASGQRLLITDLVTGHRAGLSFGALTSAAPLTSLPLPQTEQATLLPLLAPDETILAAWSFTAQLAGDEALLSFDIGLGAENLHLWRLSPTGWTAYTPAMLTYDSKGILSFTLDPASLNSAYAASGTVPEPAALALLALATFTLLPRRRPRG